MIPGLPWFWVSEYWARRMSCWDQRRVELSVQVLTYRGWLLHKVCRHRPALSTVSLFSTKVNVDVYYANGMGRAMWVALLFAECTNLWFSLLMQCTCNATASTVSHSEFPYQFRDNISQSSFLYLLVLSSAPTALEVRWYCGWCTYPTSWIRN